MRSLDHVKEQDLLVLVSDLGFTLQGHQEGNIPSKVKPQQSFGPGLLWLLMLHRALGSLQRVSVSSTPP